MTTSTIEPVRSSVLVRRPVAEVFRVFTEEMSTWWPLERYSVAADTHGGRVTAERVVFEARPGGRIYERMSDGTEADWGRVVVWEPPHRVVFTWKPNLMPGPFTEVEVSFRADGDRTRVELEHRGWEQFGTAAIERRRPYEAGWTGVLRLFAEKAGRGTP